MSKLTDLPPLYDILVPSMFVVYPVQRRRKLYLRYLYKVPMDNNGLYGMR